MAVGRKVVALVEPNYFTTTNSFVGGLSNFDPIKASKIARRYVIHATAVLIICLGNVPISIVD